MGIILAYYDCVEISIFSLLVKVIRGQLNNNVYKKTYNNLCLMAAIGIIITMGTAVHTYVHTHA